MSSGRSDLARSKSIQLLIVVKLLTRDGDFLLNPTPHLRFRTAFPPHLRLAKGDEAAHGIASDPDFAVPALARVVAGDQDHATALDLLHEADMAVHHADGARPRGRGLAVVRPIPREVGPL